MLLKELFNSCNVDNTVQIVMDRKISDYALLGECSPDNEKLLRLKSYLADAFRAVRDMPQTAVPEKLICCVENVNFGKTELDTFCVNKADFKKEIGDIERYGYMFTDWYELLGTEVSSIALNQYGVDRVAAAIFWEMTLFGFTKDEHDAEIKKQEDVFYEAVAHKNDCEMTWEELRDEICKTLGMSSEDLDISLQNRHFYQEQLREEAKVNLENCMKYLAEEKAALINIL
jgi:hypothetical protein